MLSGQSWGAIRIETERLVLRPCFSSDDFDALIELFGDPEVTRWIRGGGDADQRAERALLGWRTDVLGPFTIAKGADGDVVGQAGIMVFDTRTWTPSTLDEAGSTAQPELGWALVRRSWGNGYATEAAAAIRDWARRARSIDRLVSLIGPDNVASQRVARRLGALPRGTIRTTEHDGTAVVWEHPHPGA